MDIRKRGSERFQTALASLCLRVQSPKDLTRPFINVLAHNHGCAQILDATVPSQSVREHRAKIERERVVVSERALSVRDWSTQQ